MASEPLLTADTLLDVQSAAVRQVYHPKFGRMMQRRGSNVNKIFSPSKRQINGDGITVQVKSANGYPARFNKDINAAFDNGQAFRTDSYKATLATESSSNDFARLAGSAKTTDLDLMRAVDSRAAALDFIKEKTDELTDSFSESSAIHTFVPQSALLATVNGTPKQNDDRVLADCSATPAANTGIRFAIDGGSLSALRPNMRLDVYSSADVFRFTIELTDFNPRDSSVGAERVNTTTKEADISLDPSAMADNDKLYLTGEKDQGPISVGAWFEEPGSSDSFLGKDRTTARVRQWMRPYQSGPSAVTTFTIGMLDNLAIETSHIQERMQRGYLVVAPPEIDQRMRDEIGQDVLIQVPSNEAKGKLMAQAGFDGALWRNPLMGPIMFSPEPLATPNKIRFMMLGDWERAYALPGGGKVRFMPGQRGSWYRMAQSEPNTGLGTVWKQDAYTLYCDLCLNPWRQLEITNVQG